MSVKSVKVAFVGAGGHATKHAGVLRETKDVELVGVWGRTADRATAFARRFDTRAFDTLERMLDEARPDAVYVCVTPGGHGAIERALVERNIHFFVEKPLALDWDTAAAIGADVARAGLVTAVGYQWRYFDALDHAQEALRRRAVGLVYGHWLTVTPAPSWWAEEAQSGGQMLEQATHMVDLARMLAGEIDEVYAATARVERSVPRRGDVADASAATVRFASGAVGTFQATHLLPASYRVGLHLFCDGAAIEITATSVSIDVGRQRVEHRHAGDATARQDKAFVDAVARGDAAAVRSTYADALKTHRVTTRIVESARLGKPLTVGVGSGR